MKKDRNANVNYAEPGSPANRPRISSGLKCPGAPVKKKPSDDDDGDNGNQDWLFQYFDSAPQHPRPGRRLFPRDDDDGTQRIHNNNLDNMGHLMQQREGLLRPRKLFWGDNEGRPEQQHVHFPMQQRRQPHHDEVVTVVSMDESPATSQNHSSPTRDESPF
mmetsp:Transcript_11497/g.18461  ORF Transcript_11497/g.18461 Transcript_11497/m.18461 type:complete len:161 (+) Transcript_11497:259-741(+)|eukprot:CAMPEP_0178794434 /NCGR_PEP_ID=MMETSP0745-20121128/9585_1 /TAXON_ID=913974 /ORGANISM="Nitzschia punctata, Strain CCMP561" /LENGTH=160 /DNA_ID=CAMNT_0020452749 /DNA_START=229 /DNA_END=711 /DNA_ORIENTATION=+